MPGPRTSSNSDGAGPAGERPVGARLALITWDDDSPTGGNVYTVRLAMTGMPKEELARLVKQLQDEKTLTLVSPKPAD